MEALLTQTETLNSSMICFAMSSPSGRTTMILGIQLTSACKQELSFSVESSKEITADRCFFEMGSFTRINWNKLKTYHLKLFLTKIFSHYSKFWKKIMRVKTLLSLC